MPGVPGAGGRVPKRSDQVRRKPRPSDKRQQVTKAKGGPATVTFPDPDPNWHPIAVDMYLGLRDSGMAEFYQPSDVAMARYACELMSRNLNQGQRVSGQLASTIASLFTTLGATEGDRRRLRIELDRSEPEAPPSVALMEEYRRAAGVEG